MILSFFRKYKETNVLFVRKIHKFVYILLVKANLKKNPSFIERFLKNRDKNYLKFFGK
ncbi:MAG: hypothetical protein ACI86H_001583 [bacterium]|jgi:hypothetical protein